MQFSRTFVDRSVLLTTVIAVMAVFPASDARAADACAEASSTIGLSGNRLVGGVPFYFTPEDRSLDFGITARVDEGSYSVRWDTPPLAPSPATDGVDYERKNGSETFVSEQAGCYTETRTRRVPIIDDTISSEPGLERVQVQLSNFQGAAPGFPSQAPLFILDNDGSTRAGFVANSRSVPENYSSGGSRLQIAVLRAGPTTGNVTFSVAGSNGDVSPESGNVNFSEPRLGIISLAINDDSQAEGTEVLSITLGGAAAEGGPFNLTITDNDGGSGGDVTAPDTWFHHPRHGERYRRGSFNADTIHAYVREDQTVNYDDLNVRIALRRKMTGGACRWWKAGAWRRDGCESPRWFVPDRHFSDGNKELYIEDRYPSLRPSVGTTIANYTVYAKATDLSGNTSRLVVGESRNTFEVTRR